MRWKITTLDPEIIEDAKNNSKIEKRTTNRTLTITVGDIVGMGKSAAGAVKNLSEALPQFIETLRNIPKQSEELIKNKANGIKGKAVEYAKSADNIDIAETINTVIQPLSIIIDGMDKFKSVMKIVDIITPIAKTIARTTGVWCSPGNVADLGQMAWGLGQQILIAVATSALLNLKELVWNYEFDLYTIPSSTSRKISMLLKDYEKKNILPIGGTDPFDPGKTGKEVDDTASDKLTGGDTTGGGGDTGKNPSIPPFVVPGDGAEGIDPQTGLSMLELALAKSNGWKTQKKIEGKEYTRILYGSLMGNGIIYSDDDGETWERSSQKDKSFSRFAKIMVDGKWRYVAGSTYYVKEIVPTTDKEISKDNKSHYNKDYYNFDKNGNIYKLTKKEKDEITKKVFDILHDRKVAEDPIGMVYSDDDGETWQISYYSDNTPTTGSFENFFEVPEKEGYPARLIAASYDYNGIYYSDDGNNWKKSIFKYKKAVRENDEIIEKDIESDTDGRWTYFVGMDGRALAKLDINNKEYNSEISKATIKTVNYINKV